MSGTLATAGTVVSHVTLMQSQQTCQRKDRAGRTDASAPESRAQEPQRQHANKQPYRYPLARLQWRPRRPTSQKAVLQWRHQEHHASRQYGNRRHESRKEHAAKCSGKYGRQESVAQPTPPRRTRYPKTADSPPYCPVEQVDQRPERANVTAEPARNQQAYGHDHAGPGKRPYPQPACKACGETHQRIKGEKRGDRDSLLPRQIGGVVRRRQARIICRKRPRPQTHCQPVHPTRVGTGRYERQFVTVDVDHAKCAECLTFCVTFVGDIPRRARKNGWFWRLIAGNRNATGNRVDLDRHPTSPHCRRFGTIGPTDPEEQRQEQQQAARLHEAASRGGSPRRTKTPKPTAHLAGGGPCPVDGCPSWGNEPVEAQGHGATSYPRPEP